MDSAIVQPPGQPSGLSDAKVGTLNMLTNLYIEIKNIKSVIITMMVMKIKIIIIMKIIIMIIIIMILIIIIIIITITMIVR